MPVLYIIANWFIMITFPVWSAPICIWMAYESWSNKHARSIRLGKNWFWSTEHTANGNLIDISICKCIWKKHPFYCKCFVVATTREKLTALLLKAARLIVNYAAFLVSPIMITIIAWMSIIFDDGTRNSMFLGDGFFWDNV